MPIAAVADSAWAYNADYQSFFKHKTNKPRPRNIKWKPPDERHFKFNFDGAMLNDTNVAGIGVILRNSHGGSHCILARENPDTFLSNSVGAPGSEACCSFCQRVASPQSYP